MDAMERTYWQTRDELREYARKTKYRHWSMSLEDREAEADLAFMMAYRSYDPTKGSFLGWARQTMKSRFRDQLRQESIRDRLLHRVQCPLDRFEGHMGYLDPQRLLAGLGRKEKLVLNLALKADPAKLVGRNKRKYPYKTVKEWLIARLRGMRWSNYQIRASFARIRKHLENS